jgi:hypothetical protein
VEARGRAVFPVLDVLMSLARASLPRPCQLAAQVIGPREGTRVYLHCRSSLLCYSSGGGVSRPVWLGPMVGSFFWPLISRYWIHMSLCQQLPQLLQKMPDGAQPANKRRGRDPMGGVGARPVVSARRPHDCAILLVKSPSSKDQALSLAACSTEGPLPGDS